MDSEAVNAAATRFEKFRRSRIDLVNDENPLTPAESEGVPAWWRELGSNGRRNAARVAAEWAKVFPTAFERLRDEVAVACEVYPARLESPKRSGVCLLYVFDPVVEDRPLIALGFPPASSITGIAATLPPELHQFYLAMHDGFDANVAAGAKCVPGSGDLTNAQEVAGMYDETREYLAVPVPYEPHVADLIAIWTDDTSGLHAFIDSTRAEGNCWRSAGGILDSVDDAAYPRSTALDEIEQGILPEIGWWDRHG
ncbi:hypothetical protein AXK56_01075 [Tsukamurella pulmonis]|uniref:Uncharacterized protein n=1 Tax=Tsukamurella pulmonis TaxID=47312 RepID=A0A1H1EYI9_9ACTN|nr:hypothetical protein [Tsukamurella pulmonis]KXO91752.1 hypothetical protein AXK56_01075 [Tsukamurella pulmonis]SDQ93805.1 hypothetical protein SAMN04489765_2422 [Tsukamurella pulmonis]SUP20324.1 Uncharacterised protein [Tsukamurella pulmonis]